jgi:hypothetical protein
MPVDIDFDAPDRVQILQPYPSVHFDARHPYIRGKNRVR